MSSPAESSGASRASTDHREPARDRRFDVVLNGATGFVGRLTARHLAKNAHGIRIALAGRDEAKLQALKADLGVDWPVMVVDLADARQVAAVAAATAAVASTAGRHGLPMALGCARAGTSYADLSGEVPFVRESIRKVHDIAVETGARIVHACGFESVPSDIGTFVLGEQVRLDEEGTLTDTTLILEVLKGGLSGGNLDSNRAQHRALRADPVLRAAVADPWVLSAVPREAGPGDEDPSGPFRDRVTGQWLAPSMGAPFNSRLVRRSASLRKDGYGPQFRYREAMGAGRSPAAPMQAAMLTLGLATLKFALTSRVLAPIMDRALPPGSGPSAKVRENGQFRVVIHTRTSTGARYAATVAAKGDPGYAATSVMLGQSVLSLASDPLSSAGGVLTPSVAMGSYLADRLVAQGFTLSVARA